MTKAAAIKTILDEFDFNKVHNIMVGLNWRWEHIGIPCVQDLVDCAEKLLNDLLPGVCSDTRQGGFHAWLDFCEEQWDFHLAFELNRAEADVDFPHQTTGPNVSEKLVSFSDIYKEDYRRELESCDKWIQWCKERNDTHGMNFHQGLRSALVFNNIKMESLISSLKS